MTLSSILTKLSTCSTIWVRQRKELVELLEIETRNKYSVETESGEPIAFVAEQQKGLIGLFLRQIFGHWRSFELYIFNAQHGLEFIAHHPFRFYYQRVELKTAQGVFMGSIDRQFEIFGKRFNLCDATGKVLFTVRSPIWRVFTFPVLRGSTEAARVTKRWGGVLTEVFTDADTFEVLFADPSLSASDRALVLVAAVFIDLNYFERKA